MNSPPFPNLIPNWIDGVQVAAADDAWLDKRSPHDGRLLCHLTRSTGIDVNAAVAAARQAQPDWAAIPAVQRGHLLHRLCHLMEEHQQKLARCVALETGKSPAESFAEVGGAIALGRFFAGEGQRLYGRTTTSGQKDKYAMTVRQPCGVAGLIVAANTPIANIAWKLFPALICGNSAVLKAPEDSPSIAWLVGQLVHQVGLPPGVVNIVQGLGAESGAALSEHPDLDVLSFTGSTAVGRRIAEQAGRRLLKVSLELGGKNPFVVCDDADLDQAVHWACLSAFSNAGQRCAAGSRIIIFDSLYETFRERLVEAANALSLGPDDEHDLGPVINNHQLDSMLNAIAQAQHSGARILCGGRRLNDQEHAAGYYLAPTVIESIPSHQDINHRELFGPIAQLYKVTDFHQALEMANDSPYGLTACIHTRSFDRAQHFCHHVRSGVAVVNAGTYGSEPHMPFGGLKASGNGSREPGTEALDVYSELKDIYFNVNRMRL
jgi:acyl-CoA reductase-like NAD-dependent aldehyde dehydrogenase